MDRQSERGMDGGGVRRPGRWQEERWRGKNESSQFLLFSQFFITLQINHCNKPTVISTNKKATYYIIG